MGGLSGGGGGGGRGAGGGGRGGGSRRLLGPLVATAPQFTLDSRAASMTDTLLPAAPQPLEKEGDDYFRKVSGESTDPLSLSWQTAERAEGA